MKLTALVRSVFAYLMDEESHKNAPLEKSRFDGRERLVIGLGTGRCGTTSLARLLAAQPNTTCTHERYRNKHKWSVEQGQTKHLLQGLQGRGRGGVVADVAFGWLNYVKEIVDLYPETRFVCLRRRREEFVASYKRLMRGRNNLVTWSEDLGFPKSALYGYEECLPKYDHLKGRPDDDIFGYFYDQYNAVADSLQQSIKSFSIFDTEDLNYVEGVWRILDHCSYLESEKVILTGIRENSSL